ncbi:PQQ-binding-like beta-propeller repeat protein [Actinoplanes sp. GCM10030250]|uniref:outer membrane protein assembly factor BamB family protein n=1 Tax=Actinoplanes sp. GCM10030250 TaxID=3273376 RepID=UPI0036082850
MLIDLDAPPARRPPPPVDRRWFGAVAAAVLLLMLGGAAGVPEPGKVRQVASSGGAVVASLLTESALYTAQAVTGENAVVEIWARSLTEGGESWSARAPNGEVTLRSIGGTLVVVSDAAITVLDARDGRVRWSERSAFSAIVVGERVLLSYDDVEWGAKTTFTDLASGRKLWSVEGQPDVAFLDESGRYLVAADYGGHTVLRDTASGRILATRELDVLDGMVMIIGDRVLVSRAARLLALRLPDLERLWEVTTPFPETMQPCGGLLCVTDSRGLAAFDPATGDERWRTAVWTSYHQPAAVRADGQGVAVGADGRAVVLDPVTGRTVRELGRGRPVGDLMLRFADGQMWITGLRSGRVMGSVPGVIPFGCTTAGRFLGCPVAAGAFTVWETPR